MKLSAFKKDYQWFSDKASDLARHLAFAGIAVIWIFKTEGKQIPSIPAGLMLPLILFALALALDLLHYIVATIIWGSFHRYHEKIMKKKISDPDVAAPKYFNWPTLSLFGLKVASVISAYVLMIKYMWQIFIFS
jgi:hypothetical protein